MAKQLAKEPTKPKLPVARVPMKLRLPVHPLIASLKLGGSQPESAIKLAGYVGVSSQAGRLRLYSTLDDLSHYVEFDENAVVRTAPAPESLLPDNGVLVWVKSSTPVRYVREYRSASGLTQDIEGNLDHFTGTGGK